MNNKLIRLAELVQEDFPENILEAFKSSENSSLNMRLSIASRAISFHQQHAEKLWMNAGQKRTLAEKRATARAELAAFLFAYLSGDAQEYADSAIEALKSLGRQAETALIRGLSTG